MAKDCVFKGSGLIVVGLYEFAKGATVAADWRRGAGASARLTRKLVPGPQRVLAACGGYLLAPLDRRAA